MNDVPLISRDDESEEKRYRNTQDAGNTMYITDDEVREYALNDFGLSLNQDSTRTDFR